MKKLHIIRWVIIAVAIGVILLRSNDYSSYADFDKAREHSSNEYHIVGRLNKSKEQIYNPQIDANKFEFYMVDEKGVESKVVYRGSKPDGFDQTEKIVVAGNFNRDANNFNASQILMKCPSKYVDENKSVNT